MILYNDDTRGFYDTGIHSNIPEGSIEISRDQHKKLLAGQAEGKKIVIDKYGKVSLESYPIDHIAIAKAERNKKLSALVYDFGDGRVMQTRPKDEQNIRTSIEMMVEYGQDAKGWVMKDNKKHQLTLQELETAYKEGRLKAAQIWNEYNP